MSDDESRPSSSRRPRAVEKKALPAGPAKDLRDAVYRLYAEADRPQLAELAQQIADDNNLPGSPGKDLIGKIISGDGLASQGDTVSAVVVLARLAGRQDVARIVEQVRQSWIAAATVSPVDRLGRPVSECDPLVLEVHQAIQVPDTGTSTDRLPGYVPRAHDTLLREAADLLLGGGSSRLVTLVGGSSTGKTRACWELARYLDQKQPRRWRVWHPYDPTRPQAAVADLERVGSHTVVWLNEAQHYLMPTDPGLGERLAAGLRTLLTDPGRAPVLVLATLWPQHWDTLTVRPGAGQPDPYAQARELLAGTAVPVADTFTPDQVAGLAAPRADARLRYAAKHAGDRRITQYLAGAPELQTRYRTVGPAARALIQVAMDARRLGHPLAIPHTLLEQAAPDYLDDHDWDSLGQDWLEQALADTARPCKGARGPLTRIRSRPGRHTPDGGPYYRLADYLEQTGRTERAGVYPPDSLWTTFATTVTDPDLLCALGDKARQRGRYQHAIRLYTHADHHGSTRTLHRLARLREQSGDIAGAEVLYRQAADHGDTSALGGLAMMRERAGDTAGAEALAAQAADLGDTFSLTWLAGLREQSGDAAGAEVLYRQAADHGDTSALKALAMMAEDEAGAQALAVQAADLGDTSALHLLAQKRDWEGDWDGVAPLYQQAASYGDTHALLKLAELRENASVLEARYRQAAASGDIYALERLFEMLERAGDAAASAMQATERFGSGALLVLANMRQIAGNIAGAEALFQHAADLGDTTALRELAELREWAGDSDGAEVLYRQAADGGDTTALLKLAGRREKTGDWVSAEALYRQAADGGETGALRALTVLRKRAGDSTGADRIRMFGLTGPGEIATGLDFGS